MRVRLRALLAAVAVCAVLTPVSAAGGVVTNHPLVGLRHSTSTNWSGYAAYGKSGQYSTVSATWVQPAVTCTSQSRYAAFWVGLDGYNTNTVEQLGTEADCTGGQAAYSAWYEMYPHWSVDITSSFPVSPGRTYKATVSYAGGSNYVLSLDDLSSGGKHFSVTQKLASAKRASAEIIAEAPWSSGVLPLANFGTVNFSGSTVNGAALGTFSPLDPMTMVDPNGGTATPSGLDAKTGQNFSIVWSNT